MQINGVDFEFDIYDLDQSEAFDQALDKLSDEEQIIKAALDSQKATEMNKAVIGMFQKFFINATGVDVLAECRNANAAALAYDEFLLRISKQKSVLATKYDVKRVR